MNMIKIITLLTVLILGCREIKMPTAPEDYINVQGEWISNEIKLELTQKKNSISGTAEKDNIIYTVHGASQSETRVFFHLHTDKKILIFAGNIIKDDAPVTKLHGTIKENGDVKGIRFVRFR